MLAGTEELRRSGRIIGPGFGRQWKYRDMCQALESTCSWILVIPAAGRQGEGGNVCPKQQRGVFLYSPSW